MVQVGLLCCAKKYNTVKSFVHINIVHIKLSWFALFRYDFDDPVFDDILQWTNDFTLGNGFLNVNLFLPKFLNAIFEGKVNKQLF